MIEDKSNILTYYDDEGEEIGNVKYHKKWHGVWIDYIYVEQEYRKSGKGLYLLYYLYKKYGPIYGEFVTAGGVKLLNKFLRTYIYNND